MAHCFPPFHKQEPHATVLLVIWLAVGLPTILFALLALLISFQAKQAKKRDAESITLPEHVEVMRNLRNKTILCVALSALAVACFILHFVGILGTQLCSGAVAIFIVGWMEWAIIQGFLVAASLWACNDLNRDRRSLSRFEWKGKGSISSYSQPGAPFADPISPTLKCSISFKGPSIARQEIELKRLKPPHIPRISGVEDDLSDEEIRRQIEEVEKWRTNYETPVEEGAPCGSGTNSFYRRKLHSDAPYKWGLELQELFQKITGGCLGELKGKNKQQISTKSLTGLPDKLNPSLSMNSKSTQNTISTATTSTSPTSTSLDTKSTDPGLSMPTAATCISASTISSSSSSCNGLNPEITIVQAPFQAHTPTPTPTTWLKKLVA